MKKINLRILVILLLIISACNEEILDKTPVDKYSDAVVWSDIKLVRLYLNPLYKDFRFGWNNRGGGYQTAVFTNETVQTKGWLTIPYNASEISADRLGDDRGHLVWDYFSYIQECNVFLDNIEKLPEAYSESEREGIISEMKVLKGEALFLRALFYSQLCRSYGGVPLMDKPNSLGDDFSNIKRNTFKETIEFIVKDLDEAAELLKVKEEMELGRATKEAALGLKSRMLLFAASDLTADGTAENELVGYSSPDRVDLWTAARDAAKELIDLGTCELSDFGAPNQDEVAKKYFDFFKARDLSDKEIIWGRMTRPDVGVRVYHNKWYGPNGIYCWGNNGIMGNHIDLYQMEDGSDFFDHFKLNDNNEYINISSQFTNENPYNNREPRFYACVLHDSAVWQPRFADLAHIDPLGIYDFRSRQTIVNGEVVSERGGLDTRQGPVTPSNGTYTGYLIKKYMDDAIIGRDFPNENNHVYMRYAEIILNYAEACIELGDIPIATQYINMVRNRVGLPDFTGDITKALRYERKMELFLENNRWYDIRRWKILEEELTPMPYGVNIYEVNEDGLTTTTWKRVQVQPNNIPTKKLYWIPIAKDELNRAPQLIQNPGY